MKKRTAKRLRRLAKRLRAMLATFEIAGHGGEDMAYGLAGVGFSAHSELNARPTVQYRTVDKRGRIYLREHLIGRVFRMTEQPDGALLLEPTDAVPPSEHWAHAPKIARSLELFKQERGGLEERGEQAPSQAAPAERGGAAYEADDGPRTKGQLEMIRAMAAERLPTGKVLSTSSPLLSDFGWPALPAYNRSTGVDAYLDVLRQADPMQIVAIERAGVDDPFMADLANRMGWSVERLHELLGHKPEVDHEITGGWVSAGGGVMGLVHLIELAREIAADSTAEGAESFDAILWLGTWLNMPQPPLGGLRASELLDTPTGASLVATLLGSIESGAYL